jgi:hypothetical protein
MIDAAWLLWSRVLLDYTKAATTRSLTRMRRAETAYMTDQTLNTSTIEHDPRTIARKIGYAIAALFVALALALSSPAAADEYDTSNAGHPIRLIAYALYPVGVAIDYILLRPAHWLVSYEPLKTIFGHKD